jgi:hypothetical protein
MIVGFNTDIKYRNEVFHIQTEEKGESNPTIETLVYHNGEILLSRRISYGHLKNVSDMRDRVKIMMKSQHDEVSTDLKKGKFLHMLSLETQALDDVSLDDMVINYLNTL